MIRRIILSFLRCFSYVKDLEQQVPQIEDRLSAARINEDAANQREKDLTLRLRTASLETIIEGYIYSAPNARLDYLRLFLGRQNPHSEALRTHIRSFGGAYQAFSEALRVRGPLEPQEVSLLIDPEYPLRPVDNDVLARYLTTLYQLV